MTESDSPVVIQNTDIECGAEPKMVKCINCGFAAKRARVAIYPSVNREYSEIPFDERRPEGILEVYNRYHGTQALTSDIACFRGKVDLGQLAEQHFSSLDKPNTQLAEWQLRGKVSKDVLEEDRPCGYWYQYEAGRTPQEHLAELMAANLEEKRKAFELELFELSQKVQQDSKRASWFNFWAAVILGIVVIIISLMQLRLGSRPTQTIIQQPGQQQEQVAKPEQVQPSPQE